MTTAGRLKKKKGCAEAFAGRSRRVFHPSTGGKTGERRNAAGLAFGFDQNYSKSTLCSVLVRSYYHYLYVLCTECIALLCIVRTGKFVLYHIVLYCMYVRCIPHDLPLPLADHSIAVTVNLAAKKG